MSIKARTEAEVAGSYLPETITNGRWYIWCPGCYEVTKARYPDEPRFWMNGALHCFSEKVHQFNGNREAPTLSPSLLVHWKDGETGKPYCCHSYVRDGKIQFLGDCTHPLANQTVDLMDAPPVEAPAESELPEVAP